jgi:hypothetical protein
VTNEIMNQTNATLDLQLHNQLYSKFGHPLAVAVAMHKAQELVDAGPLLAATPEDVGLDRVARPGVLK